jgi:4-diphosphocytidyl-2-C-methyl-D-erythritol kinase
MSLEKSSPCKVNLLLNILGKRSDGFHELETLMHPVSLCDTLAFARAATGVALTCSDARLPVDAGNLVHRAASAFLAEADIPEGVRLHLEKRIPMAAGLGGGSGNAATTLLGLNEMFGHPLDAAVLHRLAAQLGSDVPFFLQSEPALATGRGEKIEPLDAFPALRGTAFLLIHPGFGIATAWAYQQLARFPEALKGRPGRARSLAASLQCASIIEGKAGFYNSLEAPAFEKYPVLPLYQEFLRNEGALAALMSGSGSTTFAITPSLEKARGIEDRFKARFGNCWTAVVSV